MEKYNHFAYGLMLAQKLKPITHTDKKKKYFSASAFDEMSDIEESVSSMSGTILIAMDGCNSSFLYPDSDSLIEVPEYSFVILTQTNKGNDTQAVQKSQKECKAIAKQVIAKMLQDAYTYTEGLQFLHAPSFKIEGIGPISENFYGVELSFSFQSPQNYEINTEMWED